MNQVKIYKVYNGTPNQLKSGIAGKIFFGVIDPNSSKQLISVSGVVRFAREGSVYLQKKYGIQKGRDKNFYDVQITDELAREVMLKAQNYVIQNNLDINFFNTNINQQGQQPPQYNQQPVPQPQNQTYQQPPRNTAPPAQNPNQPQGNNTPGNTPFGGNNEDPSPF
jgi:hypothetical protein